jgi:hypothetical protein
MITSTARSSMSVNPPRAARALDVVSLLLTRHDLHVVHVDLHLAPDAAAREEPDPQGVRRPPEVRDRLSFEHGEAVDEQADLRIAGFPRALDPDDDRHVGLPFEAGDVRVLELLLAALRDAVWIMFFPGSGFRETVTSASNRISPERSDSRDTKIPTRACDSAWITRRASKETKAVAPRSW